MTRIPFHHGLFLSALIGLMGREPTRKICSGWDGYYEYKFRGANVAALTESNGPEMLDNKMTTIRQWIDLFDVLFSGTHCYIENDDSGQPVLVIKIVMTEETIKRPPGAAS